MDNFIAYYISYFQDKWKYYICIEKAVCLISSKRASHIL